MAIIGFTPEAEKILEEQEQFLHNKLELLCAMQDQQVWTRDQIVSLFQTWDDMNIDQYMVRRGEGENSIQIETVRWYWYLDHYKNIIPMLMDILHKDHTE